MSEGKYWRAQSNPAEVTPIFDLKPHVSGMECWCNPTMKDEVIVHNALDNREKEVL